MVKFMVLSAPRSASTWVANWLTTERTLCLHDPILEHTPEALDALPCDRMLGVACTALALLPELINAHAARKVVVHRDLSEVNQSLTTLGLSSLGPVWVKALERIHGFHVYYEDLFDQFIAARVYEHLTELPFDGPRHALLRDMYVEPHFDKVKILPERVKAFRERLEAALG